MGLFRSRKTAAAANHSQGQIASNSAGSYQDAGQGYTNAPMGQQNPLQPSQSDYSGPVIATMFFRVKEGLNIGDLIYNPATANSYRAQSFREMEQMLTREPGITAHYWGHQIEDPSVVVYVIEWASAQAIDLFTMTPAHDVFAAGVEELYDIEHSPSFVVEARFNSVALNAFEAPVTKLSFFTAPYTIGEQGKLNIQRSLEPLSLSATTVGQSTGMFLGWAQWIDDFVPGVVPQEHVLQMVSGYASLDDHTRWTQTEGYQHIGSIMGRLASDGFTSRQIYGRSIFSVRFNRGE